MPTRKRSHPTPNVQPVRLQSAPQEHQKQMGRPLEYGDIRRWRTLQKQPRENRVDHLARRKDRRQVRHRTYLRTLFCIIIITIATVKENTQFLIETTTIATKVLDSPPIKVSIKEHYEMDRITYYNAVPEQTDATPNVSACGPNIPNQVAVSRDLFRKELHCGDVIDVWIQDQYLGQFTVWDTMNPRFKNTLDILTETTYGWGLTTGHVVVRRRQ